MAQQRYLTNTRAASEQNTAYPQTTFAPETMGTGAKAAQGLTLVTLLIGVWMAISPWILDVAAASATPNNLIIGIAVGVFALVAMAGLRGFSQLQWANVALGGWLIASPFALAATSLAPAALFVNNIVSGAVILVLSAAASAGYLGLRLSH
ncbi:MAG: SPW repeat protein [Streptosporangiaceae bacterium]